MPELGENGGQQLEAHIRKIYSHLHKIYRRGHFERELQVYGYKWPELDDTSEFYDYRPPGNDIENVTKRRIKYSEAIESLYELILFLELNMQAWVRDHGVLILQIKNLIYEVTDYSLAVPPKLGQFFIDQAKMFQERARKKEVERFADELRGAVSALPEPDNTRARAIKVQIIAALCGVIYLYRSHMNLKYDEALGIVESIETYVKGDLPGQHENPRESFGLIGLTMYLKGRLLVAKGEYADAQRAFAQSSDAYIARLDQKNDFLEKGLIGRRQFEDKKTVTLRRTALVSALGVGYLAFINSRISKALAALRMSRAALKQNVGEVYAAFTDVLFFACRRAEGSSERQTIEEVIKGIKVSRNTLKRLVPDSHYLHRAGIELAIALYYRVKSDQNSDEVTKRTSEDYSNAMALLEAAIEHGKILDEQGRHKNQRLLTEGLFIRSYIRRCLPDIKPERKQSNLSKAEDDARVALDVAKENSRMQCEALIALGSVHYEQSKYHKSVNNEHESHRSLTAAERAFNRTLKLNDGKNARIEAVCYLKLAKLNLLDPSSVALAHDFFKKWKAIENRVEHAFCHYMAQDVEKRLSEAPLMVVDAESPLTYNEWKEKLLTHFINTTLIKLSEETRNNHYDEEELLNLIAARLKLKFTRTKAYDLIEKRKLVEELQRRNKQST